MEQCAAGGKASAVERCVLRLDLATLDFNQARPRLNSFFPVVPNNLFIDLDTCPKQLLAFGKEFITKLYLSSGAEGPKHRSVS